INGRIELFEIAHEEVRHAQIGPRCFPEANRVLKPSGHEGPAAIAFRPVLPGAQLCFGDLTCRLEGFLAGLAGPFVQMPYDASDHEHLLIDSPRSWHARKCMEGKDRVKNEGNSSVEFFVYSRRFPRLRLHSANEVTS